MSPTTIVLIIAAVAVIAAIAFFTMRGRTPVPVATSAAEEDPALSATGEAMIVGDVMPIDSGEPVLPAVGDAGWRSLRQAQTDNGADAPPHQPSSTESQSEKKPAKRQSTDDPVQRQSTAAPAQPQSDVAQATEPAQCQSELVEDCAAQRAEIRWSKRFEPRTGALDDATRLNLLRDLGIVRAPWGVPLLTQAYEEEPEIEHRRAALRALAAYRHPDTQPTFESALRTDDEESRAIAATALGALRIRAALPS